MKYIFPMPFFYLGAFTFSSLSLVLSDLIDIRLGIVSFKFLVIVFTELFVCVYVLVLVAQSCPTLCDPMDHSPPGSPVHGILQARILEWVAISFSRGSSGSRDRTCISGFLLWQADSLPLCHRGSYYYCFLLPLPPVSFLVWF